MRTVWLIRHGESESNAGLPTTHTAVTALTERGRAQAERVALAIPKPPDLVVTSPYLRTQQTALPTLARFPQTCREEWPVHEFTYLGLPAYQATTGIERRPLRDAYWSRCDPHYIHGEGAESFADLLCRVETALARIREGGEHFALVFSHGLFAKALLWRLRGGSPEASPASMRSFRTFSASFRVPNAAILPLHVGAGGMLCVGELDTGHLDMQ
jgi:broad specificity phosphatase PhoE